MPLVVLLTGQFPPVSIQGHNLVRLFSACLLRDSAWWLRHEVLQWATLWHLPRFQGWEQKAEMQPQPMGNKLVEKQLVNPQRSKWAQTQLTSWLALSELGLHDWATQPLFSCGSPSQRAVTLAIHQDLILLSMTAQEADVLSSRLPLPSTNSCWVWVAAYARCCFCPKNFLVLSSKFLSLSVAIYPASESLSLLSHA